MAQSPRGQASLLLSLREDFEIIIIMNPAEDPTVACLKWLEETSGIESWKELINSFIEGWDLSDPATLKEIAEAESQLGVTFPEELKHLYLESNGIRAPYGVNIVMPLPEMLERNMTLRAHEGYKELYMPFDHLLFFGAAGNGDLFGYTITMNGRIEKNDIFGWDHESDSRRWIANNLKDLMLRYASGMVVDASC